MELISALLAGFFAAVLSSMGMGGGGILLVYLTLSAGIPQLTAQGINLLFFLPVACVSLVIHHKNHLVNWKMVLPAIPIGLIGVFIGSRLASWLGSDMLSKIFAVLLLWIGLRELLAKREDN